MRSCFSSPLFCCIIWPKRTSTVVAEEEEESRNRFWFNFFRDIFSIFESFFWEISFDFFPSFFPEVAPSFGKLDVVAHGKLIPESRKVLIYRGKRDVKTATGLKLDYFYLPNRVLSVSPLFRPNGDAAYFRLLILYIFFLIPNSGKTKCVDHRRISRVYVGDVRS